MSHEHVFGGARYQLSLLPLLFAGLGLVLALCALAWITRRREGERFVGVSVAGMVAATLTLVAAPLVSALLVPVEGEGAIGPSLFDVVDPWALALEVGLATLAMAALLVGLGVGAVRAPTDRSRVPGLVLAGLSIAATAPMSLQLAVLAASFQLPSVTAELPAAAIGADATLRATPLGAGSTFFYWPSTAAIDSSRAAHLRTTVALIAPFVRIERDVEVVVGEPRGDAALDADTSWTWRCRRSGTRVFGIASRSEAPARTVRVAETSSLNGLTVYQLEGPAARVPAWSVGGWTYARRVDGRIGRLLDDDGFAPLPGYSCGDRLGGVPRTCSAHVSGNPAAMILTLGMVMDEAGEMTCTLDGSTP